MKTLVGFPDDGMWEDVVLSDADREAGIQSRRRRRVGGVIEEQVTQRWTVAGSAITADKIADLAVTGAKIGDATIGNAKIGDATIGNAKISALDAGKVTTGTLSTAVLGVESLHITRIRFVDRPGSSSPA